MVFITACDIDVSLMCTIIEGVGVFFIPTTAIAFVAMAWRFIPDPGMASTVIQV